MSWFDDLPDALMKMDKTGEAWQQALREISPEAAARFGGHEELTMRGGYPEDNIHFMKQEIERIRQTWADEPNIANEKVKSFLSDYIKKPNIARQSSELSANKLVNRMLSPLTRLNASPYLQAISSAMQAYEYARPQEADKPSALEQYYATEGVERGLPSPRIERKSQPKLGLQEGLNY